MATAAPSTAASRRLALLVLCAGFLMIILDQTIVNVALPSIRIALGFSQASLAWVVNAYLITFGGLLLLAGRLGDLLGRKRIFLTGLALFTLASVWCGLSSSQGMLIAARFVQGAGGAIASAVILGMIVMLFREPGEQSKAIGVYSFVGAGGASIGLLMGGIITQAINWHWIFFVNVPVGLLVGLAGARVLDADQGIGYRNGADVTGSVLITGALVLGVYTILEVPSHGWGSAHTLIGAAALALFALFLIRERVVKTPLVALRIFRSRNLSGGNIVLTLMMAGMFGQFFLGALYLQRVLGYHPLGIGLAFLPVALTIGVLSVAVSPRVNTRFGERAVVIVSLCSIAVGLALLGRAPANGHYVPDVLPALIFLGIGGGLAFPALVSLAMSGATPSDSGLASGIVNTIQQVGGALGLAVLATLATARTNRLTGQGQRAAVALTGGYHLAFFTASAIVVAGVILTVIILRPARAAAPEVTKESVAADEPAVRS